MQLYKVYVQRRLPAPYSKCVPEPTVLVFLLSLSGFFYVSKSDSEGNNIKAGDLNSEPLAENEIFLSR